VDHETSEQKNRNRLVSQHFHDKSIIFMDNALFSTTGFKKHDAIGHHHTWHANAQND
jgi:hypothetical protein